MAKKGSNPLPQTGIKRPAPHPALPRPVAVVGRIRIGSWVIEKTTCGRLWISDRSGEGGEFSEKDFAKVVGKFYEENF